MWIFIVVYMSTICLITWCIISWFICCPLSQHMPNYKWILLAFMRQLPSCQVFGVRRLLPFFFFFFWHLKWSWSEFFECKSWILNVEATYRWPETVEFHILVIELFIFHSPCCPCLRHFGRKGCLTLCLHKEFKLLTYSDKMSGFVLRFLFFFLSSPICFGQTIFDEQCENFWGVHPYFFWR